MRGLDRLLKLSRLRQILSKHRFSRDGFALLMWIGTVGGVLNCRTDSRLPERELGFERLSDGDATSGPAFSSVVTLEELPDGRLVALDSREGVLKLVDLRAGTVQDLGQRGAGPLEYMSASALVPFRGESLLVFDHVQRRFLVVGPDGKAGRSFSQPSGLSSIEIKGSDDLGQVFCEPISWSPTDTVPVVRWEPSSGSVDTLMYVDGADLVPQASKQTVGAAAGTVLRFLGPHPLGARDLWTTRPGAHLSVVRVKPFRVEWRDLQGRLLSNTPSIPYQRIRVTRADRDARPDISVWPEARPPYSQEFLRIGPDGFLWLKSLANADSTVTVYFALGQDGLVVRRIGLPAGGRLVGVGRNRVYVATADESGLVTVTRYSFPTRAS